MRFKRCLQLVQKVRRWRQRANYAMHIAQTRWGERRWKRYSKPLWVEIVATDLGRPPSWVIGCHSLQCRSRHVCLIDQMKFCSFPRRLCSGEMRTQSRLLFTDLLLLLHADVWRLETSLRTMLPYRQWRQNQPGAEQRRHRSCWLTEHGILPCVSDHGLLNHVHSQVHDLTQSWTALSILHPHVAVSLYRKSRRIQEQTGSAWSVRFITCCWQFFAVVGGLIWSHRRRHAGWYMQPVDHVERL